jgi:hypothetical protein
MAEDFDDRLDLLARAQETYERTLRLHTDVLASHADAHREHRERMAALQQMQETMKADHDALLALLGDQEQRLRQHEEHMARLDTLMQAIKDLVERWRNGH